MFPILPAAEKVCAVLKAVVVWLFGSGMSKAPPAPDDPWYKASAAEKVCLVSKGVVLWVLLLALWLGMATGATFAAVYLLCAAYYFTTGGFPGEGMRYLVGFTTWVAVSVLLIWGPLPRLVAWIVSWWGWRPLEGRKGKKQQTESDEQHTE